MSVSRTTLRDINEALARLDKERESLLARLSIIDRQADALRVSHEYLTQLHEEAQIDAGETAVPAKNLRNEMVQILRGAARPLHYTDLRNQLENRGVQVNGVDKAKTVGAHLSNDTRFKKLGRGMWALASWPASVTTIGDTITRDDNRDDADEPEESDDPFDVPFRKPADPFDLAFPNEEQPQEPPKPQRPMRRIEPEREETVSADDFDDVPF